MGILKEFQDFAIKGNVLDMAVGIIIGGAFGTIVKSLVDDVIMPPIGKLMGGVDFSDLFINLGDVKHESLAAAKAAGTPVIAYGQFLNNIISFLIVAWAVFMLVKAMNSFKKKEAVAPPPPPPPQEVLLKEIRDLLAKR
jgi:large conductance mechanosensitive channel